MVQATVTVLAVINPVVCGSIFLTLTPNLESRQKRQAAVQVALSILIILVASAFIGLQVLGVFGISLDVFRIVGGSSSRIWGSICWAAGRRSLKRHRPQGQAPMRGIRSRRSSCLPLVRGRLPLW
jgi:multiple antibiotic resistance protein